MCIYIYIYVLSLLYTSTILYSTQLYYILHKDMALALAVDLQDLTPRAPFLKVLSGHQ